MRTETLILYKFNELPKEKQKEIVRSWCEDINFSRCSDITDTLKAFCKEYNILLEYYDLEDSTIIWFFEAYMYDTNSAKDQGYATDNTPLFLLQGKPLHNALLGFHYNIILANPLDNQYYNESSIFNECPLTGVCFDIDILTPIRNFLLFPCQHTDFKKLIDNCMSNLIKCYQDEIEYYHSDAGIIEDIITNDYDFTIEGKLYA